MYRQFIDINPAVFWTADDEGRVTIASEAGAERLGVPPRFAIPNEHFDLVHPDDRPGLTAAADRGRADGALVDTECRFRVTDGSYRWMRIRARYDAAKRRWHGAAEDIHDRRETEAALRIANERLALAFDANDSWAWDLDVRSGRFWFSDRWRDILGRDDCDPSNAMCDPAAFIHPDDRTAVNQAAQACLAGHEPGLEIDYRIRHKNGSWVWVHDRGRVIERDAAGKALRAIGTRTDITARKAVEAQSRASEAYVKTVLDNISEAVIAVDPTGRRGFYNKAYASLFLSELGGRDWSDLAELFPAFEIRDADGRLCPDDRRPIMRVLRGETIEDFEAVAVVRRTGRTYRLIYNGQPVYGADGSIELAVLTIRDITEKRAVQAALKASEERLRLATDGAGMGTWDYDIAGATGIWSESACRLLGYPVATHRIWRMEDFQSRVHPDDVRLAMFDATIRDSSRSCIRQFRIIRADDGAVRWIEVFGTTIRDETGTPARNVGVFFDITDRRLAEDGLRESEARLAATLENIEEGVVAVAPDAPERGFMNGAFRRIFGSNAPDIASFATLKDTYEATELIDAKGNVLGPDERPMMRALRGERVDLRGLRARFSDGRELDIACSGRPLFDAKGKVRLGVLVVRDVTQQLKAEADVATLQQELIHVSRVSAMGTMAGSLAHELNQPLAAIVNYAAAAKMMLDSGNAPREQVSDVLKRVGGEAVRAGQIISRLRRFITKGEVDRQPASLSGIVREALAITHSDASARGTQVKLKLDVATDIVLADRVQLQQVIFNVVRNAVEAMESQAESEITIASRPAGDLVELLIADRGPGLAPEVAAHLFQPFVTTKETGMGIGLPICRSIMRAHGGDIRAEPRPSGGTVFILSLPPAKVELAAE